MVNQVMFRASIAEYIPGHSVWGAAFRNRWVIPVMFRSRDEAIDAARKAVQRKITRLGGDWVIDIKPERVVII